MSYHKNTIYETVIQCSYNKDYHNHITTNINYVNEKRYLNFRMQKLNVQGKYWIGLFLDIQTVYNKTQKYSIPIQILIPDNFPFIAPLTSVCLPGPNTIINPENKDIDPKNCLISTNSIKKWDWSTSLNKIIEEISSSFNKAFPILQVQQGQNPHMNRDYQGESESPQVSPSFVPNYNPNQNPNVQNFNNQNVNLTPNIANFNSTNNMNSGFNKVEIKDDYVEEKFNSSKGTSSNNVNLNWDKQSCSSQSTDYSMNTSSNQNQNMGNDGMASNYDSNSLNRNLQLSPKQKNIPSPFAQQTQNAPYNSDNSNQFYKQQDMRVNAKEILIQHIIEKIQTRISNEVIYQNETNEYLETAKLHLHYKAQKLADNLNKSDEVTTKIQQELDKIKEEVENLKNEVTQKSAKFINKDNCFDFVYKDNKFNEIVNLISSQATIEDILIYIKKGFEKGIISFDETVRSIRVYSRELMKLKFIKDKILSAYQ